MRFTVRFTVLGLGVVMAAACSSSSPPDTSGSSGSSGSAGSSGSSGSSGSAGSSGSSGDAGQQPEAGPDAAKASTVPCAYHDFKADKDITSCDAATQYCLRSYTQTLGPGSNNFCAPIPAGCAACPCLSNNADAAWKKANNNTVNCTGALIKCTGTNGAFTVDCVK